MKNLITTIISVLIIAITTIYIATQLIALKKQQLLNDAVQGCLNSSGTYEYIDAKNGVKTISPQKDLYTICITNKGYSSSWK